MGRCFKFQSNCLDFRTAFLNIVFNLEYIRHKVSHGCFEMWANGHLPKTGLFDLYFVKLPVVLYRDSPLAQEAGI